MKFSIVIPLFNKTDTIKRAVYSALNQPEFAHQDYEILIINDGSTDNSLSIVDSIKNEFKDRNIIIHSQINAGVSAARNKGISLAKYDLITFLDADDTYQPNFLIETAKLALHSPHACAYATGYQWIDSNGDIKPAVIQSILDTDEPQLLNDYFSSCASGDLVITSSSVCIRKQTLEHIGGFPEAESMGEDQWVWAQLALTGDIAITKKVCANYYSAVENSLMQSSAPLYEMPFSQRLQVILDSNQAANKFKHSIPRYIAGHLLDLARRNIQAENIVAAKQILADNRTKVLTKRYLYWRLRLVLAMIKKHIKFN